jgi:hypothetical protein
VDNRDAAAADHRAKEKHPQLHLGARTARRAAREWGEFRQEDTVMSERVRALPYETPGSRAAPAPALAYREPDDDDFEDEDDEEDEDDGYTEPPPDEEAIAAIGRPRGAGDARAGRMPAAWMSPSSSRR